jgi:hypothetical protein
MKKVVLHLVRYRLSADDHPPILFVNAESGVLTELSSSTEYLFYPGCVCARPGVSKDIELAPYTRQEDEASLR